MPALEQGDIFETLEHGETQLAIVFGCKGFNGVSSSLERYLERTGSSGYFDGDPFQTYENRPIQTQPGKWLWLVPVQGDEALPGQKIREILLRAARWAMLNNLRGVATNGTSCSDLQPRGAGSAQADFWKEFCTEIEKATELSFRLISMSDVFSRE